MYDPSDISHNTIEELFFKQTRRNARRSCGVSSFDIQFSDQWL